jgi:alpha-tubulin suppressor-like RCC1 family protein
MHTRKMVLVAVALAAALHAHGATAAAAKAKKIATGASHACALLTSGNVKCWGDNSYGQLGIGDIDYRGDHEDEMGDYLPIVDLDAPDAVTQIAVGAHHSCALLYKGVVKCWGDNQYGQLGLGDEEPRGDVPGEMGAALPAVWISQTQVATQIVAGGAHTCALLADGSVKCWGLNDSGQLGQGSHFNRGDDALEMGTYLSAVPLGNGRTAVQLAAGLSHTCARLDDGSVKCWGNNYFGQLGQGNQFNRGDDLYETGNFLSAIALGNGRTATSITAGYSHTCALLDNGTIKCWGRNDFGQLGLGDPDDRGDNAGEMGNNLPSVSFGWVLSPPATVAAGGNHTCALLGTNLRCWGLNSAGQLGLGDSITRGDHSNEMGNSLPIVDVDDTHDPVQISGGFEFTCARLGNNRVKCWGNNMYGQLGLGDPVLRGTSAADMGEALPEIDLGTQ